MKEEEIQPCWEKELKSEAIRGRAVARMVWSSAMRRSEARRAQKTIASLRPVKMVLSSSATSVGVDSSDGSFARVAFSFVVDGATTGSSPSLRVAWSDMLGMLCGGREERSEAGIPCKGENSEASPRSASSRPSEPVGSFSSLSERYANSTHASTRRALKELISRQELARSCGGGDHCPETVSLAAKDLTRRSLGVLECLRRWAHQPV
jgi:hypothetical protein